MTPPRFNQAELLDLGFGTLEDVRANLKDMWHLNRLTGGIDSLMRHLAPRLRQAAGSVHLADLGTGSAQLPVYLSGWARRHNIPIVLYPLDISARNLCIAHENVRYLSPIHLLQADGAALPFASNAIDYFISTLLLHHFEPDSLIELLRHTFERARRGIVMCDITRGIPPQVGFRIIQPFVGPHPMTLHDGIRSIRRAYTPDELLGFARQAGLANARVYRHPLWRMTLVVDKPI